MRTSCPACGAPVDVVQVEGEGTVVLEAQEETSSDANRYVIVGHNPLRAQRLTNDALRGLADHKFDCPGQNAGRR